MPEEDVLYFVCVELNLDDVRELRRITQLEMAGTLDSEGLKAFVEVAWLNDLMSVCGEDQR